MNFSIKFLDKKIERESDIFQVGKITINNYSEMFQASLSYWNKSKYIHQWQQGIKSIIDGIDKSYLVTSMFNPKNANYIFLWLLYREENIVYIQNQILFLKEINKPFDETHIYNQISDREIVDEEGNKISEWYVNIDELKEFVQSQ